MHIGGLSESKYLKKEDVGPGKLLTIRELVEGTIEKEDKEERAFILYFEEEEKGMVLKPTNANLIAKITGSEETDDWIGHKIVLFNDPSISFAGKITGGIRVRAPRQKPTAAAPRAVAPKGPAPRAVQPARPAPPAPPTENEYADGEAAAQEEDSGDVPF